MYNFIIDGNYFLRRIHGVSGLSFIENPKEDDRLLTEKLSMSLASLMRKHQNYVQNVIFVRDFSSWRKKIDVIVPKELMVDESQPEQDDQGLLQTYKANRVHAEDTDWGKVYACFDKFCKTLNEKLSIPVVQTYGAEGDDILYVISKMLNAIDQKVMLWTSDYDAAQCVTSKTVFSRMTRKQKRQHITLFIDPTEHHKMNNATIFDTRSTYLDAAIEVADSVETIDVAWMLLEKITKGDAKDNVPPLLTWKGGKTNRKPTTAHMNKALNDCNVSKITVQHLYDDKFIKSYVSGIIHYSKQTRDLEHTIKVFKSNRKLLVLSDVEIPADLIADIEAKVKEQFKAVPNLEDLRSFQKILDSFETVKAGSFLDQFNL